MSNEDEELTAQAQRKKSMATKSPTVSASGDVASSIRSRVQTGSSSPPAAASRARLALTLTLYCLSGTLLTLVNKLVVKAFPYPNVAIFLQNLATVALLQAGTSTCQTFFGNLPSVDASLVRMWWPLTAMFVGLLVSSMLALMHVSAVTLIVFRNLTSLSVAALEYAVLGTPVPLEGALALLGMIAGAVVYAAHDLAFSWTGYAWLVTNLITTSAYQVWVKRVISSPEAKSMGPFGFSYVNNLLSLPALALISVATGELLQITQTASFSRESLTTLFLSCVLGCTLSVSAFMVNMAVSATSMMVANNVNKFLVIILSEIFVQSTLDAMATAGCASVLVFGLWYARSKEKKSGSSRSSRGDDGTKAAGSRCLQLRRNVGEKQAGNVDGFVKMSRSMRDDESGNEKLSLIPSTNRV